MKPRIPRWERRLRGRMVLYQGPMASGKTARLLRLIERFERLFPGACVFPFVPAVDVRSGRRLHSRTGQARPAWPLDRLPRAVDGVLQAGDLIVVDEAQFADESLLCRLHAMLHSGVHVAVGGLAHDFAHRPFGIMPRLELMTDIARSLTARCVPCGDVATHTWRRPELGTATVLVGGDEAYEPRCAPCWLRPQ